jgi:molybdopterin converting factor small subunit
MKVFIVPGFSELFITVNPSGEATRDGVLNLHMPWLIAPWPEAREKGVAEMDVEGETVRALLTALSEAYKKAGVDFEPINHKRNDMDEDYDVLINGKNYYATPDRLDTKLKDGDRVKVKILWRWDG